MDSSGSRGAAAGTPAKPAPALRPGRRSRTWLEVALQVFQPRLLPDGGDLLEPFGGSVMGLAEGYVVRAALTKVFGVGSHALADSNP